ncbi:M28 family peptidase [Edaphobacter aggregans]|uniref:M28 family peptidase n=1 Tax=Edaphobacter aggregans TaxID=570835 RepID=UPI0009FE008F|nr:M28 family peptidase [Edaphobacter aggregans]
MTKKRGASRSTLRVILQAVLLVLPFAAMVAPSAVVAQKAAAPKATGKFSGKAAYELTKQFLAAAPHRWIGSPGHAKAEEFIKSHFTAEAAKGNFETDSFMASTPAGLLSMKNLIVKYPGKKDGIIVIASHYETNYPLRDIDFVGANDGAATSALLIELGNYLRAHPPEGYSVWLVFDDGEEAIQSWSARDSLYGTRHLAAKWSQDGTLQKVKAFLVTDMLADRDLDILDETQSTPWLRDLLRKAAANTNHTAYVGQSSGAEEDDHLPFLSRGVPSLDIIDVNYGPHTASSPDGWHHTAEDTLDKISARSLQISGDLMVEMIRLINQHG